MVYRFCVFAVLIGLWVGLANEVNAQSCTEPSVCGGRPCVLGLCRDSCFTDGDCDDNDPCTYDICSGMDLCFWDAVPEGSSCIGQTGVCRGVSPSSNIPPGAGGACVECIDNGDCPPDRSRCAFGPGICFECLNDGHCGGGTPYCRAPGICVECESVSDCEDGTVCTTDNCNAGNCTSGLLSSGSPCENGIFCDGSGSCSRECVSDANCPSDRPRCTGFSCVECLGNGDCGTPEAPICYFNECRCTSNAQCGDGNPCTTDSCSVTFFECSWSPRPEGTSCPSGVCSASGQCEGCLTDANCSGATPRCDTAANPNRCVACVNSAQCEDGNPCTNNTCAANVCQQTNVMAGVSCGGSNVCNGSGSCTGCSNNAQCDDSNDCTTDTCATGACVNTPVPQGTTCLAGRCDTSGQPICVECLGDSDCSGATPFCDSGSDQCVACRGAGDCSDGLPCTTDLCVAGACQNNLSGAQSTCRPASGPCDRPETCDGVSSACPPDARQAAGFVCATSDQSCERDAVCNGLSSLCPMNPPANSMTSCRGISGECDAPEFCDGMSFECPADVTALPGTVCSSGVCEGPLCVECRQPSDCFDGNPCTSDLCNSGTCANTSAPPGTACGNGLMCNGTGMCAGCSNGSQCADGNPCTDDLCNGGECSNPVVPSGTACTSGGVAGVCEVSGTPSCGECVSDLNCSAPTPFCDETLADCVACRNNADCDDGNDCTADTCRSGACEQTPLAPGTSCGVSGLCSAAGLCAECLSNSDCGGALPLCDPSSSTCVACTAPGVMCPGGTECDPSGACVPTSCESDLDCAEPSPTCFAGRCLGCLDGSITCNDGDVCNVNGRCGLDPDGDPDADGLLNQIECPTLENCPDTDGDGNFDYFDVDDDADGIETIIECPGGMCIDTDWDSVPNNLDTDDDGDGLLTTDEFLDGNLYGADVDGDGLNNWLDIDSDGDQSPDRIEGRALSPGGVPYYLDVNFLAGGSLSGGALHCNLGAPRESSESFRGLWSLLVVLSVWAFRRRAHRARVSRHLAKRTSD